MRIIFSSLREAITSNPVGMGLPGATTAKSILSLWLTLVPSLKVLVSERPSFDKEWDLLYLSTSVCKRALADWVADVVAMILV
jgi:hypothetical protein